MKGFPSEDCPMFTFSFSLFMLNEMACLQITFSTRSQNMNRNLLQSLEINLPHTLRCNIKFAIIWPPLGHPLRQHWEKFNYCFANLEDNSRNVPKCLRTGRSINSGTTAAFSSATLQKKSPNNSLKVSMSVTNILLSITSRS